MRSPHIWGFTEFSCWHILTLFSSTTKTIKRFYFFGWCKTFLFSHLSSLFYILGVLHSTCVLESEFGFIVNCNFKKSSLFRVRNLGGVKAHFGLGNFCVNEQTNHCQNDSYIRLTQNLKLNDSIADICAWWHAVFEMQCHINILNWKFPLIYFHNIINICGYV